jgi:phosphoglycerate dehydrogenase-like enzyme
LGTPTAGTQVLLHVEACQEPRTLRLTADPEPTEPEPTDSELTRRDAITIAPNLAWYGVLRRDDTGRWPLVQSIEDTSRHGAAIRAPAHVERTARAHRGHRDQANPHQ